MNSEYPGVTHANAQPGLKEDNVDDKAVRSNSAGPAPQQEEEDDEGEGRNARERRKIEIKFIQDKGRRHITFSKRKHGIMKKAWELSILTGTQVLLLVVSETGLVYTYSTPKLQPLVTQAEGKKLIQDCLNAPDIPREEDKEAASAPTSVPVQTQQQAPPPAAAAGAASAAAATATATGGPRIPIQPGMMPHDQMMRQPQYMPGLEPGTILMPADQMQVPEGYIPSEYGYMQGQQPQQRYPL